MKNQLVFLSLIATFISSASRAYNYSNIQYKIPGLLNAQLKLNNEEFENACIDYQKRLELNSTIIHDCQNDGFSSLACMKLETIRTGEKSIFGEIKKFSLSIKLEQGIESKIQKNDQLDFLSFEINKMDYDAESAIFKKFIFQKDSETKKMIDSGMQLYPAKIVLGNQGAELIIYSRDQACDLYHRKLSLEFEAPVVATLNNDEIKAKTSVILDLQDKVLDRVSEGQSTIRSTVSATSRIYTYLKKQKHLAINETDIESFIHQLFPILYKNEKLELRKIFINNELQSIIPKDMIKNENSRITIF